MTLIIVVVAIETHVEVENLAAMSELLHTPLLLSLAIYQDEPVLDGRTLRSS